MATLAVETPLQDEVRALVAALNAELLADTPPEHCHHMSVDSMAQPDTTVFVARVEGRAVACGALRRHAEGIAEVKRMYTVPEARGQGIGRRIVGAVRDLAVREGYSLLVLETSTKAHAAARVYEQTGFQICGPVLDYPPSPYTVFYALSLR
jgi:putative acetyltransferase